MKRILGMVALLCTAGISFAQTDGSAKNSDTIKVGNFIIITKQPIKSNRYNQKNSSNREGVNKVVRRPVQKKSISTNWWIVDIGFANLRDNTNYGLAQSGSYFKQFRPQDGPVTKDSYRLNTGKSANVNLWFFMQKLNIRKHVLNLKYGLGLEMYNFRYDTKLSYAKDPMPHVFNDSIRFTKNKWYAGYITVPLLLNVNTTPDKRNGFSFSAGISAGYLVGSRTKQISAERGKDKLKGDFNMEPIRLAAIGELGIGPVRLYGSYSLNKLQKDITRMEQFPYTVGIRLSNW